MIELTLEQAERIVDLLYFHEGHRPEFGPYIHTDPERDVINALLLKVSDEKKRWAPKPSPRYVVFESKDGNGFVIFDTVNRQTVHSVMPSAREVDAQRLADSMNGRANANG